MPTAATRDQTVALEAPALTAWREGLRPFWTSEPASAWHRWLVRIGIAKPVAMMAVRNMVSPPPPP